MVLAHFEFTQLDPKGQEQTFVFALDDPEKISLARSIIAGQETARVHVQGTIVATPASYNPGWAFHLRPDSIGFFENQIEVCDANMSYVAAHLDEVGGSTLPRSFWCPWSSRLTREVHP